MDCNEWHKWVCHKSMARNIVRSGHAIAQSGNSKTVKSNINKKYYLMPMKLGQIENRGDTMKRIIAFLFVVTILFSACSGSHKLMVGESMSNINKQYTSYISINTLSVYKINENYLITIDDGDIIQKLVEFSSDRKCRRIQGFSLIKNYDINQFLNINFNKLTEKIGQPHVDIGSGFYIPAYITEDANLICFKLENEIVIEVIQQDLLTNKIVDRVSK